MPPFPLLLETLVTASSLVPLLPPLPAVLDCSWLLYISIGAKSMHLSSTTIQTQYEFLGFPACWVQQPCTVWHRGVFWLATVWRWPEAGLMHTLVWLAHQWGPSGPAKNVENPFGKFCVNLFECFCGNPFGEFCGNPLRIFCISWS